MSTRSIAPVDLEGVARRLARAGARVRTALPLSIRESAGLLALAAVVGVFAVRVAVNAPIDGTGSFVGAQASVGRAALAGTAAASLALSVVVDDDRTRLGLIVAAVFAVLATVARPAFVPAVGALLFGAAAVSTGTFRGYRKRDTTVPGERIAPRATALAVALALVGLALSGLAAVGVGSPELRSPGSLAWLCGLAALGGVALESRDPIALGVGLAATAAVAWLAFAASFAFGAAALIAGGVLGAPALLVAAAVGGALAGAVALARREGRSRALGAGVVLAAGVPTTVLAGLAAVVGLALLGGERA